MREIPLTQGKFALVDDDDFDRLNNFKWSAHKGRKTWYAVRNDNSVKPRKTIRMHNVVLGVDGMIDHKDLNGLNNKKSNLRAATPSQNAYNRRNRSGASKFKGVRISRVKEKVYWRATITSNRKRKNLGSFPYSIEGELMAAMAYNKAATELHGDFALLNEV